MYVSVADVGDFGKVIRSMTLPDTIGWGVYDQTDVSDVGKVGGGEH